MGINLPCVAFKGINNFYSNTIDFFQSASNKRAFNTARAKVFFRNVLCKLGLIPYHMQSSIIFKEPPAEETIRLLREMGYKFIRLPKNPYLK